MKRKKLVLVGFMGVGKSTAGAALASELGINFVDSDVIISERFGDRIQAREEEVILEILRGEAEVLALGGGALTSRTIRAEVDKHIPVYLEVSAEEAWRRVQKQKTNRPLADKWQDFLDLFDERTSTYEAVAYIKIPSGTTESDLSALLSAYSLTNKKVPKATRMLWAHTKNDNYPVYISKGLLGVAQELLGENKRYFLVTDEHVNAAHGEKLRRSLGKSLIGEFIIPTGERSKTLAQVEQILEAATGIGLRRGDTWIAFGGGVVGDLTGFCAATYQRGAPFVQIPTTLVGQSDAAYGGKTGVNLKTAKNYVGAFHQPAAVLVDTELLLSLPGEELSAGFAEVLKTALLAGGELWERVMEVHSIRETNIGNLDKVTEIVHLCAQVKTDIVASDECDENIRALLNLGHTFGHALEATTEYKQYGHGQAVAVGLLVALRLSEEVLGMNPQITTEVMNLLQRHELATTFVGPTTEELVTCMNKDKKNFGDETSWVLLSGIGDGKINCCVNEKLVTSVLTEFAMG